VFIRQLFKSASFGAAVEFAAAFSLISLISGYVYIQATVLSLGIIQENGPFFNALDYLRTGTSPEMIIQTICYSTILSTSLRTPVSSFLNRDMSDRGTRLLLGLIHFAIWSAVMSFYLYRLNSGDITGAQFAAALVVFTVMAVLMIAFNSFPAIRSRFDFAPASFLGVLMVSALVTSGVSVVLTISSSYSLGKGDQTDLTYVFDDEVFGGNEWAMPLASESYFFFVNRVTRVVTIKRAEALTSVKCSC